MLAASLLVLCLIRQDQATPISLHVPVGNTAKAVAELSRVSGIPMTVTPLVASEVVYLNVKERPVSEVMTKLAAVTCAEWRAEDDGSYTLNRPDGLTRGEVQKERARRLKKLKEEFAKIQYGLSIPWTEQSLRGVVQEFAKLEAANKNPSEATTDEQWAQMRLRQEQLTSCDPVYRALARCLKDIKPEELLDLADYERRVYTLQPNRVQRPLGANSRQALELLLPEQEFWGKALKVLPDDGGDNTRFMTDHTIEFFGERSGAFAARSRPWERTKPFTVRPDYVLFSIACTQPSYYQASISMKTADGVEVMTFDDVTLDARRDYVSPVQAKDKQHQIQFSADSKALFSLMGRSHPVTAAATAKALELIKPRLMDPVNHDPLAFGNTEGLDTAAQVKARSVVACLTDEAFMGFGSDRSLEQYLGYLSNWNLTATETESWFVVRPTSFADHWEDRTDRSAMAEYARALLKSGRIELDPYVQLHAKGGTSQETSFPDRYLGLLVGIDPYKVSIRIPHQRPYVRLYASLTDAQKGLLQKGQTLPYSSLTRDQQYYASLIVYGDRMNSQEVFPKTRGYVQMDRTEELPTGLLEGAGIRRSIGAERVVVFNDPGRPGPEGFYADNIDEDKGPFGMVMFRGPRLPDDGMANVTYDVRQRHQVTLQLHLQEGHAVIARFEAPLGPATQQPVPLAKLPADIQAKLKATIESFDKVSGLRRQHGGKGDPPPPSR